MGLKGVPVHFFIFLRAFYWSVRKLFFDQSTLTQITKQKIYMGHVCAH